MTVDVKHKPLEMSHHWKANDRASTVVTTFCSSRFNYTHCYTWCAHSSSVIRNKSVHLSGARDHLVERLYPNGTFAFQETDIKKKKGGGGGQWHCAMSNKCTESDSTVSRLTRKIDWGIQIISLWCTKELRRMWTEQLPPATMMYDMTNKPSWTK